MNMTGTIDSLARDLRYALRSLSRRPAFAFSVVITLAVGIGATTAIFSVVYSVLIKPFAVSRHNTELRALKRLIGRDASRPSSDVRDRRSLPSTTRTLSVLPSRRRMALNCSAAQLRSIG
jgi:hypothetical protein